MQANDLLIWRRNHQMSQESLAMSLGVSRRTLIRWENGHVTLPDDLPARLGAMPLMAAATTEHDEPPLVMHATMPDVAPHACVVPVLADEWEDTVLRALGATFVPGTGMVDDKPGNCGAAVSPWFNVSGSPPSFVLDNVQAIRTLQDAGTTPEQMLEKLQKLPRWPLSSKRRY